MARDSHKGVILKPEEFWVLEAGGNGTVWPLTIAEAQKKYPNNKIDPKTGEWKFEGKTYAPGEGCNTRRRENVMLMTIAALNFGQIESAIHKATMYTQDYWDD